MCHTDKDLALYTSLNYCVAIPATEADGPMPRPPGQEVVEVVARLSGIWRGEGEFGKTYDDWAASLKPEDILEFCVKNNIFVNYFDKPGISISTEALHEPT